MLKWKELRELWKRDNLLVQALEDSHEMLERTNTMFRASVDSLRKMDQGELEFDIYAADQEVNRYEQKVRRKILKHLAITGGINVAGGLVLTSIVIDIERVGDYTKNIMELAIHHPRRLDCGKYEEDVLRIEAAVSHLFERIVPVLTETDQDSARGLIDETLWIKKGCDTIDEELIAGADGTFSTSDAVTIALYVRYLKRIAAHLLNALSSVINPFEKIGFREDEDIV